MGWIVVRAEGNSDVTLVDVRDDPTLGGLEGSQVSLRVPSLGSMRKHWRAARIAGCEMEEIFWAPPCGPPERMVRRQVTAVRRAP